METQVFDKDTVAEAAALIKAGEVVAFPTETVYGLGADATSPTAALKVYAAKHRPADNPLIVTVAGPEMVAQYATITPEAKRLMDAFWPGPLTIILNIRPNALSMVVTGGLQTAAFRMPQNALTRQMITLAGRPIVGPSANLSGKPSGTRVAHVLHDFDGAIAGILDDGPTSVGVESTVIDMTVQPPAILRPGEVTPDMLAPIIGEVATDHHKVGAKETPKAPGMKYKHYAPSAQVVVLDHPADLQAALAWAKAQGQPFGVMATDDLLTQVPAAVPSYSLGEDVQSATHNLFAGLRWFDLHPTIKLILAEAFAQDGLGAAYMNRLLKSAGNTHFQRDGN
ncbi:L-threonylcarbamoyladenylate synthase [Lacticaseibacillus parakribbianus]|uniref:L-threonylcarbamoyladenylate synthase n=1 Tax=Lacticaseibacillus parakribbianus TaxID=2970927 RepID=UPI0021CB02E3|nr:L-threonylcarbamoyladenylate synthase [Lacticaseibacillus parakribbianus]